jgi:hypothetical protein
MILAIGPQLAPRSALLRTTTSAGAQSECARFRLAKHKTVPSGHHSQRRRTGGLKTFMPHFEKVGAGQSSILRRQLTKAKHTNQENDYRGGDEFVEILKNHRSRAGMCARMEQARGQLAMLHEENRCRTDPR